MHVPGACISMTVNLSNQCSDRLTSSSRYFETACRTNHWNPAGFSMTCKRVASAPVFFAYEGWGCVARETELTGLAATAGSAFMPVGRPADEIMYSGYAEIPCSWRSRP